ncbi:MAG TPA: class I SAM-dependent methyltransferase [Caldilineaceae bacterium]|nr:class I SAM-dependent methyltransferase [Caldilineaceae bacterium]
MEAWDRAWQTTEGRAGWLTPERFVVELVETWRAAGVRRVLDLGCGVGRHALLLARSGFTVDAMDASESGLAYTRAAAAQAGVSLTLTVGDMAALPYAGGQFDAVLTWNVIYHGLFAQIRQAMAEIERCLQPQGHLVCSFISTRHPMAGRGVAVEPRTYVIPGGGEREHPHHYFNRADIDRLLKNFTLVRCEDVTQKSADDYHWQVYARRTA